LGKSCLDPSHCGRASEDVESLAQVVAAFVTDGGLQSR
jgi:hypothetical protein